MSLPALFEVFLPTWANVHQWLALACVLVVVHKLHGLWRTRRTQFRVTEIFSGSKGHWLFGNILEFKLDGTDFDLILKWAKQYPDAFTMKFGPFMCFLVVYHPEYVKALLSSTEPKDDVGYRFSIPWIGNGLLVSSGPRWFRNRRLLTPGFHYDILKAYVKVMSDTTATMLKKWESYTKSEESFELFEHVSLMTLDTIMKCAFSYSSNCQTESGTNEYIKAVYELSYLISRRLRVFPYHSDLIFHLSPSGYRYRKACKIAHNHTEEVIKKRKETLKGEKELESIQSKRNLDFLDILLCARDESHIGLSDEEIRAEVDTFMFEGHDTTASGISFIFYCLACHPEHQTKCREEITEVLQHKDTIDWDDLNRIPYTTMCIKEALRLYPPVPGIARKLTKPMTFFDGVTVPAGCNVSLSMFAIHRNPAVWENPHVFDPLRFLPENVAKRSPHSFVPFSAGPRNCIGQNFAMNEMKVVVALTLKRYRLIQDPTQTPKLIPRLVLRSLNGIHIKIKPVDS
ncbi:cytochrome P450 4T8 [Cynoglossus semilaevis]|uniref:Cytochrome P450, family 4, subfamily T, polypeptide 8 n=1 Tax=Cynoglossus semilaevis TaxID=244447 RepID=A0A3P8WYS4_CYNSE|nr:cytochrome P450 4B1-like [Cynoglossus semilaevis]